MIIDSKNNVPLHNRNMTKIIDGFEYDTASSELIGHKLTDDKDLTANAFYILYRTPGGYFFQYDQKSIPGTNPLIVGPEIKLTPKTQKEAEAIYKELSDPRMSFNEAFRKVIEA